MITHGKKQISEIVYARKSSEGGGAVRLTNIIRGAQVVFGGLKPSFAWLEKATKAAILAAFGQTDGKAVIKATNAYLNQLAASDKDKATALAGFINEDPMMVCSLGLQPQGVTMPERRLVGDGNSWINAGRTINLNDIVRFKAYRVLPEVSGERGYFGVRDNGVISLFLGTQYYSGNTILDFYYNNAGSGSSTFTNDGTTNPIEVELKDGKLYLNGTLKVTRTKAADKQSNINYTIFGVMMQDGISRILKTDIVYLEQNSPSDEPIAHFVPYIGTRGDGMVDILNGTFHPNQGTGTFTDYYLRNGQPWAPSTP